MLTNLAVWYLRKKRRSVLIGYNVKGGRVMAKHKNAFIYDNNLTDVEYRTSDNYPLNLPEGEFVIRRQFNSNHSSTKH